MNTFSFPQYRTLGSFNRHYKIVNERLFIEATLRNGNWEFQVVTATQYPEILRIQDMLNEEFSYEISTKETEVIFESFIP